MTNNGETRAERTNTGGGTASNVPQTAYECRYCQVTSTSQVGIMDHEEECPARAEEVLGFTCAGCDHAIGNPDRAVGIVCRGSWYMHAQCAAAAVLPRWRVMLVGARLRAEMHTPAYAMELSIADEDGVRELVERCNARQATIDGEHLRVGFMACRDERPTS